MVPWAPSGAVHAEQDHVEVEGAAGPAGPAGVVRTDTSGSLVAGAPGGRRGPAGRAGPAGGRGQQDLGLAAC